MIILAGKEYGTGSSRDCRQGTAAARGARRHRGELRAHSPIQPHRHGHPALAVPTREDRSTLGLTGLEYYDILGLTDDLKPGQQLEVRVRPEGNLAERSFQVVCRIDTPLEAIYFRNGGILHTVLRNLYKGSRNERA